MKLGTCVVLLACLLLCGCVANDQGGTPGGSVGSANGSTGALLSAGDREVLTFERWSVVKVVLNPPGAPWSLAWTTSHASDLFLEIGGAERRGPS